jgi:hypothetical protein
MSVDIVSRLVRRLSGQGALDNVEAVLAARASVDDQLRAFARRVTPVGAFAVEVPAAA